mmetsp:Transcript_14018/g.35813  ORF Transcript_14018/g.35813 Transcript_14018/m.35813 type:complete len:281 (-) Transcript_14018:45-887(-)
MTGHLMDDGEAFAIDKCYLFLERQCRLFRKAHAKELHDRPDVSRMLHLCDEVVRVCKEVDTGGMFFVLRNWRGHAEYATECSYEIKAMLNITDSLTHSFWCHYAAYVNKIANSKKNEFLEKLISPLVNIPEKRIEAGTFRDSILQCLDAFAASAGSLPCGSARPATGLDVEDEFYDAESLMLSAATSPRSGYSENSDDSASVSTFADVDDELFHDTLSTCSFEIDEGTPLALPHRTHMHTLTRKRGLLERLVGCCSFSAGDDYEVQTHPPGRHPPAKTPA